METQKNGGQDQQQANTDKDNPFETKKKLEEA